MSDCRDKMRLKVALFPEEIRMVTTTEHNSYQRGREDSLKLYDLPPDGFIAWLAVVIGLIK